MLFFDSGFAFSDQVNSIRKLCFYNIHEFARILHHPSKPTAIAFQMPWSVADLITVTHFCPVYLSKILILFGAFKILFVGLFADFLVFHRLIVFVKAYTGCWWNNEFNLKTLCLHTGLPPHLNWALVPFSSSFILQGAIPLLISFYQLLLGNNPHTSKSQLNYSFSLHCSM